MDASRLSGLEAWQRRQGVSFNAVLALLIVSIDLIPLDLALVHFVPWWAVIMVDVSCVALVAVLVFKRAMKPPDFVTHHGVAFWTDGIKEISEELMVRALDRFLLVMSEEYPDITQRSLRKMLSKTGIEWRRRHVSILAGRHQLKHKDGIQHNYRILLRWIGTVDESAFYHELLHLVNQFIRLPNVEGKEQRERFHAANMRHEESDWWSLEGRMYGDF